MIMTITALCTRCGINEAPLPTSIEVDPLCLSCDEGDEDLDKGACPGYGEYCGNLLAPADDLCPDCTMARLNAQSPRIPR
jgi:hypothetical protein